MSQIDLPWIQSFKDRHGKLRCYFRKPGHLRVRLPGLPGSAEFMAAYADAVAGVTAPKRQVGVERVKPGSIDALVVAYYGSAEFKALADSTQATYRGIIERFRAKAGKALVGRLQTSHVRNLVDSMADRPAAANNLLKVLRVLMRFAVARGWRKDDPTLAVAKVREKRGGFHTWSEAEIEAFETRWPTGTRARLALALLLYTAQRRSDVVRMGRQHVRGDVIHVRQVKTDARLALAIHPALQAELAQIPAGQLTFLQTREGKGFSAAGFTNWFVDCAKQAGLPGGCTPHGLRKAASRRLAEAGCSASDIQAVTGHTTLKEVARYTAMADQESRARRGISKL